MPLLRPEVRVGLKQAGAHIVSVRDAAIGGVPGLRTAYTMSTATGTLHAEQLEVLPKADRACFITLTGTQFVPASVLATAATTAQYP